METKWEDKYISFAWGMNEQTPPKFSIWPNEVDWWYFQRAMKRGCYYAKHTDAKNRIRYTAILENEAKNPARVALMLLDRYIDKKYTIVSLTWKR